MPAVGQSAIFFVALAVALVAIMIADAGLVGSMLIGGAVAGLAAGIGVLLFRQAPDDRAADEHESPTP